MTYQLRHVDTCLPCYLTDHHNRPGERLLGVAVDGATTHADVLASLESELQTCGEFPEGFDYDAARAAIREQWETVADMAAPFDSALDSIESHEPVHEVEDDAGESCHAYFVLTFPEEEPDHADR